MEVFHQACWRLASGAYSNWIAGGGKLILRESPRCNSRLTARIPCSGARSSSSDSPSRISFSGAAALLPRKPSTARDAVLSGVKAAFADRLADQATSLFLASSGVPDREVHRILATGAPYGGFAGWSLIQVGGRVRGTAFAPSSHNESTSWQSPVRTRSQWERR